MKTQTMENTIENARLAIKKMDEGGEDQTQTIAEYENEILPALLVTYASAITPPAGIDRKELIKFAKFAHLNHLERRTKSWENEVDEYLKEQL